MAQVENEHASDNPRDGLRTNAAHATSETTHASETPHTSVVPDPTDLRIIGRGTCGTIYTSTSRSTVAYKIGRDRDGLWNDIRLTARVHRALSDPDVDEWFASKLQVPAIKGWVADEAKECFWADYARFFPESHARETTPFVFALSLIPTIDSETRQALLWRYDFTTSRGAVLANPENDFCLIRPYLGLATREDEPLCRSDNLWNFPFTREDFRSFPLDSSWYFKQMVEEMATGLAIIHWHAHVDGMDIEFVLGGRADWDETHTDIVDDIDTSGPFCSSLPQHEITLATHAPDSDSLSHRYRRVRLYVLDFDKASPVSFDQPEAAIERLVTAVTCNDPYFPDPNATSGDDLKLWQDFRRAYLRTAKWVSESLVEKHGKRARKWPARFMDQWERKAGQLLEGENGEFIEFGD